MMLADVPHKRVHVLDHRPKIFRRTALARGTPVTACVPGEDCDVIESEHLHDFSPAAGMLMSAMKKEQRLLGAFLGDPGAIEQLGAVVTPKYLFEWLHAQL